MRSLSRALVVSALTLPLAFAGMGVASAGGGHGGHECNHWSCNWTDIDWTSTSDDDIGVINAGIIG